MKRIPLIILIPSVLLVIICAFAFGSEAKFGVDFFKNPFLIGVLTIVTLLLIIYDALDKAITVFKISTLSEAEKAQAIAENNKPFWQQIKESAFEKQSEKEEEALIIDHGFDGITELDNNLPKWWLYLLYFTMICAGVYGVAVVTSDFANPEVEYEAEVEYANAHKVKPTLDQVVKDAVYDKGKIAAGQKIFDANCVTCHEKGGAGAAGPNLTDEFWINQRTKDSYSNIVNVTWSGGTPGTAMVKWGEDEKLTQDEIYEVAAYVESLRGVKPPGKPKTAQGTLAPWSNSVAATDAKKDTVVVTK